MTKICRTCGVEKPIEVFPLHFGYRDGHMNDCKECAYRKNRERYYKRKEEYYSKEGK